MGHYWARIGLILYLYWYDTITPTSLGFHCNTIQYNKILHKTYKWEINDLVQDCSNSSALAMELLQSCTKLSKCLQRNKVCCENKFLFQVSLEVIQ